MLTELGHTVSGLALDPPKRSLFNLVGNQTRLANDVRCDIRDADCVRAVVQSIRPDIIIHFAAQALVRNSYEYPGETATTNFVGTLNVLEAATTHDALRALLIITTDKVYHPERDKHLFKENAALGGHDIYSASKAAADLLTSAWARSFPGTSTALARGGNVIGGGDFTSDRLFPHIIESLHNDTPIELRYPEAVRPWQHVLDCLDGYLTILEHIQENSSQGTADPWNVGPASDDLASVSYVADLASEIWGRESNWTQLAGPKQSENPWLALDTSKMRDELNWTGLLDLRSSIEWTIDWHRGVYSQQAPLDVSIKQIYDYWDARNA